jgi:MFS family permease
MAVPAVLLEPGQETTVLHRFEWIMVGFMILEMCVGLFMPVAGTLRSKYVPDALQGGILNIFRLPLNAIVVSGTYATNVLETHIVFRMVCGSLLAAALLQVTMIESAMRTSTVAKPKAE